MIAAVVFASVVGAVLVVAAVVGAAMVDPALVIMLSFSTVVNVTVETSVPVTKVVWANDDSLMHTRICV